MKKKEWLQLEQIANETLNEAKRMGATAAEVALSTESGLSTTVRLGTVETIEFNHNKSLGLTVYRGKQKGSVSTTDFNPNALKSLIDKAYQIASFTEEDPASGLADKQDLAVSIPDLDLFHPGDVQPDQAILWAKECEEAARAYDKRIINSEGATFSTHSYFRVYANSLGFLGSIPSSLHSMSCAVVGGTKGGMQRDYDFTAARDIADLMSFEQVGQNAATRTLRRLEARKIKTCEVPVLFEAPIAASLLSHFIAAILGGNLYRKSSFLVDQLGKSVFPAFVNIEESPHILKALGSAPFDQEGVANYQHDIVREGVLQSYVLSSYSARRLNLKTTGNCGGVHNLRITPGEQDLPDLLKALGTGLFVTELMGHGVNIVTGDYSRGAAGFWVENGEIQYPVEEITIAGNLKEMFANLSMIGSDVDRRGNILTGSLLIDRMMIAGT